MKNVFTVFFKKDTYNQHLTYPQNANKYVGNKSFETLDEATDFANTVNATKITDTRIGINRVIYKSIKEIDVIRDLIKDQGLVESATTEGHVSMFFFTKNFSYPCTYIFNKD